MPSIAMGFRPFDEQVAFFRRKLNVPTAGWTDLWQEHHAHGFMVAGVARADLLNDLRGAVDRAIAGGIGFDQFQREFSQIADRAGWDPRGGKAWRARVIYDTNIRQSFNAGRWQQLNDPDMALTRPYLRYRHSDRSKFPRPLHQSWDGLILRRDDPWWRTHAPQNGWMCKCYVEAVPPRELRRLGKEGPDTAPDDGTYEWTDKRTGEVHTIPNGIDPGFAYNVGEASRALPAQRRFGELVMRMPLTWRTRALSDATFRAQQWFDDFAPRVRRLAADEIAPEGATYGVGFLSPAAAAVVASDTPTALLAIADHDVAHALRTAKASRGAAVTADQLQMLPRWLARPDAVLRDRRDGALIYVHRLSDTQFVKIVVRPGFTDRRAGELRGRTANWVRTVGIVDRGNLRDASYELIEGRL